jgi:uncharacterized delta-60 repeat protein
LKGDVAKLTAKPQRADRALCLIGMVALLFECPVAAAGPLDLDPTFNKGSGKVVTSFQLHPEALAVALQKKDGKIIAVGHADNGDPTGEDFALVRYNPDGSIDKAFGTDNNGRVSTDFGLEDSAYGVVIQPDGKIVVAGDVVDLDVIDPYAPKSGDFALARYNSDGTLDTSFGKSGRVQTDFGAYESATGVALLQDGKIVVVGQQQPNGNDSNFLIARYMPNGDQDINFGDAGKVIEDFGAWDIALAVAIQNDSKIVVVGSTWGPNFQPVYGALARYNPEGTLDGSFDYGLGYFCAFVHSCGKVKVSLGGGNWDYPVSVALRKADGTEDGKIVVAGQFGLARFNANGTLDGDFGNAGIMDNQDNTGNAVAILGNNHIVVAGLHSDDFAVAIYEPTGEQCSGEASVTTDFNGHDSHANAMAIDSDGKILLVGGADNGTDTYSDFALARYEGGDCPPTRWLGFYAAYNPFVHPQDLVGPPVPPEGPYNQLAIGSSQQLAIPASNGDAFAGPKRPGYQAFELTNAARESREKGSWVAVTNAVEDLLLEVLEAQQLLVPTDIAAGRVGGETMSGSRSAPLLKCYRVKIESGDHSQRARKQFTITDGLKRTWNFAVGEPKSLCKPIDRRGRELIGPALSLVGYQVKDLKTAGTSLKPVRLPTASEFGARVLRVEQPELLFVPSLAE